MKLMTLVIAHRGSGGPDNTIEAFQRAISLGADMIEFDIRQSSDGQLVILHDDKVDGKPVAEMSYNQLDEFFSGRLVKPEQLIDLANNKIGLNAEIKINGVSEEVAHLFSHFQGPLIISSFEKEIVTEIKMIDDQLATGLVSALRSYPEEDLRESKSDYLISHFTVPAAIARAKRQGLPLIGWTINNRRRLNRWINEDRVFAVITDRVERALSVRSLSHENNQTASSSRMSSSSSSRSSSSI